MGAEGGGKKGKGRGEKSGVCVRDLLVALARFALINAAARDALRRGRVATANRNAARFQRTRKLLRDKNCTR